MGKLLSVADPGCLSQIPDPTFFHPGSRIRIKEFKSNLSIVTKKIVSRFYEIPYDPSCLSRIPDPDPWVKKAPDPDPKHWGKVILSRTYFVLKQFLYTYLRFLRKIPEYSNCLLWLAHYWRPLVVRAIFFKLFTVHSSSVYFACTFSPFCSLEIWGFQIIVNFTGKEEEAKFY